MKSILKFILKAIILILLILIAFYYGRRKGILKGQKECNCADTCIIEVKPTQTTKGDTTVSIIESRETRESTESHETTETAQAQKEELVCPPSVVVEPLNVDPDQDVVLVVPKEALTVVDSDKVIITKTIIEEKTTVPAIKTTTPAKKTTKKTTKKPAAKKTPAKTEPAPAKTVEPLENETEEILFCFDPNEDKALAAQRIALLIQSRQILTKRHGYMVYLHIPEGTSEDPVVQERIALISQAFQDAGFAKWRIRVKEDGKGSPISSVQTKNDAVVSSDCIVMTVEK